MWMREGRDALEIVTHSLAMSVVALGGERCVDFRAWRWSVRMGHVYGKWMAI